MTFYSISSIFLLLGENENRVPSISQNLKKHLSCNFTQILSTVVVKTGIYNTRNISKKYIRRSDRRHI